MSQAIEIIVGAGKLYVAPAGTAAPAVNEEPGAEWIFLGPTSDGVQINYEQSVEEHTDDHHTGPRKATRSSEALTISGNLAEATVANYAKVLNDAAIENVAAGTGTAGYKRLGMHQGPKVKVHALLWRGDSPEMDGGKAQYWVPMVYQGGAVERSYTKDGMTLTPFEFHALEDESQAPGEEFGYYEAQTSAPL